VLSTKTDDFCQFITPSVHLCVQHDGGETQRVERVCLRQLKLVTIRNVTFVGDFFVTLNDCKGKSLKTTTFHRSLLSHFLPRWTRTAPRRLLFLFRSFETIYIFEEKLAILVFFSPNDFFYFFDF